MKTQVKILIFLVVVGGVASLATTLHAPSVLWPRFGVYLAAILLSSGMKVGIPKCEGTMSVNFPFILLGILQLSPLQAVALAVCSVLAQCNFRVVKRFTVVQTIFNLANVTTATVLARLFFGWLVHHGLQMAPALAMASVIYFLATGLPVNFIIASETGATIVSQWREEFLWYVPFYVVGAILAAAADLISSAFGWMTSMLLLPLVYTIYRAYAAQVAIARDREQHIIDNEALHLRTIEGLAMAIEAKDQSTHEHLLRVRVYSAAIGEAMGLDQSTKQALLTAAFLHDIGKLAVPEHIINKPGKLTHEEFEKMKIHPVVGADILERVNFPYPVVPIVRSHHEAWDGSGYPDGLRGEEIPIGARILTVVDCFDALASDRPYRKALSLDEAMALIRSKSGIQFDPKIVSLLESRYLSLEEQARQQIGKFQPLRTDLLIERGGAPGAGLEPQHEQDVSRPDFGSALAPAGGANTSPHYASLNLIAAAGQEAKALFELSQMLGSSLSARETSSMMSGRLRPLIPYDCFAVYLKADEVLVPQFLECSAPNAFVTSVEIPIGEGLSGWVAKSARPIINGNPTVEPTYRADSNLLTPASSAISIPLFELDGSVFGVLTLYSSAKAAFSKDHLRILQAIESKFSLSLQNALRFRSAESDARIDHVTQLPNIRSFLERMETEVEKARTRPDSEQHFGVAVCDLNGFKAVNDRYGHLLGNEVLRVIAGIFRESCRAEDVVARMGGDEFVFLFPSMDVESGHRRIGILEEGVQRAREQLRVEVGVSTSVGLAFYPLDGQTAEELMGVADRRMYLQKQKFYEVAKKHPPLKATESVAVA
jgi:diguanylate cyclase (GGDEF)-like protein/putative nucleotidyltransferase with HDIG domain